MIRLADYVLSRLNEAGINQLFYVPGGQCVYLTDALRRSETVEGVEMHHEQAVSYAAVAYASLNETLGAGLVTTGCAGTNTMTGILHAYQDSIPLIMISGQQNYADTVKYSGLPLRQVGIQEADIETIMKPVTKYVVTVDDPKMIAWHLDKALYLATHGRKGPVWVDLPLNVQNTMIDEKTLVRFVPNEPQLKASEADLDYVVKAFEKSKRPVLLIGNGVRSASAKIELIEFATKHQIPVVESRLAHDILSYDNPLNFGLIGGVAGANRYANFIVQNSDLLLVIGSRLSIEVTGPARADFAREAVKIVVDVDRIEHTKNGVHIDRFIHADAKAMLEALLQLEIRDTDEVWLEKCRHYKEIFSYSKEVSQKENAPLDMKLFMLRLSELAPDNTCYVSDAGFTGAAAPCSTKLKSTDRFVLALSQGEMGFALPGALGIASMWNGPVVSYNGDGSVMMNLQELQTMFRMQKNVKLVIINNNGYSGVRHGQKAHFRGKSIGTDPSNGLTLPSFEVMAKAFGINYLSLKDAKEADSVIKKLFADDKPCIFEVYTDPDQFDMHNGLVMYGKRKFGFRPIEDQSPFIDRETFFKEMIVKPMDTSSGDPV
ncbi:MAG: thiamine pyrophosphate-binding protein [Succinivibrio sp.]